MDSYTSTSAFPISRKKTQEHISQLATGSWRCKYLLMRYVYIVSLEVSCSLFHTRNLNCARALYYQIPRSMRIIHPPRNANFAVFQALPLLCSLRSIRIDPFSYRCVKNSRYKIATSHPYMCCSFYCQSYERVKYTFGLLSDEIVVD